MENLINNENLEDIINHKVIKSIYHLTKTSYVTIVRPDFNNLKIKIINVDILYNINIDDINTLILKDDIIENNSMYFVQNCKELNDFITLQYHNHTQLFGYIKYDSQNNQWIYKNEYDDDHLYCLNIVDIEEIDDLYGIGDNTIGSIYYKCYNLVIIKFKNHHIYLHNVGHITNNTIYQLTNKFKDYEYMYVVFDLKQISLNNSTEIVHIA
jgi:ribosomal protein L23